MKKFLLIFFFILSGCLAAARYEIAAPGALPDLPEWDIEGSDHFAELQRTYGKGLPYERAKIKYLLEQTHKSNYSFIRMDHVYDSVITAKHLRKKYMQRFGEIRTARDYIDKVASISTGWRRPYLMLTAEGIAYPTGDILKYELNRLENFMDGFNKPRESNQPSLSSAASN